MGVVELVERRKRPAGAPRHAYVVHALAAFALGACQGVIDSAGPGASDPATDPRRSGPRADPATDTARRCAEEPVVADHAPLRRLSDIQFANTVRDLATHFGVEVGAVENPFPSRGDVATFSTSYHSNTVSGATASALQETAESISAELTAELEVLLGCAPAGTAGDPCVNEFAERFAFRAFRRPPTDEVLQSLTDLYDDLVTVLGPADSVRAIIETVLQSPLFLYIRGGEDASGERAPFDAYALASRLSYFLWDSMPDEALFDAAATGALLEPGELRTQVGQMLDDPRAAAVTRTFHREWLRLGSPGALEPTAEAYPGWSSDVARSVVEETGRFIDLTVWERSGTLTDLLTSRAAVVDPDVAALYGLEATEGWSSAELPQDRRGLLTRAHFLASHRPVFRGVVTIDRLLCRPLTPPDDVNTSLTEPSPDEGPVTPRDVFEMHSADPACAGCHDLIDPIGFSFEHYGADGAYRDAYDNGLPIDASGHLEWPVEVSFTDSGELIDRLAEQQVVHGCYAERLAEWAIGRGLDPDERCLAERFSSAEEPLSVRELLTAIAISDLIRVRGPTPTAEATDAGSDGDG